MPETLPPPGDTLTVTELPDGRIEISFPNYIPVILLPATYEPLSEWERQVVVRKLNAIGVICCTYSRLPVPSQTGRFAEEGEMFVFTAAAGEPPLMTLPRSFALPGEPGTA